MSALAATCARYVAIPPLREWGFGRMLLVAVAIHAVLLMCVHVGPAGMTEQVPVRVLSFQLGEGMFLPPEAEIPVAKKTKNSVKKVVTPTPAKPKGKQVAAQKQVAPTRQTPEENTRRAPEQNVLSRIWGDAPARATPREQEQQQQALLQRAPKQYVRQYGLPALDRVLDGPASTAAQSDTMIRELTTWHDAPALSARADAGGPAITEIPAALSPEVIRQRYEQRISAWVAQHKLYPASAAGKEGRVVVRIRIDRLGYVRNQSVEKSSGVAALDQAALDMIKRANPLPKPPANYPAGELIEFLIPIGFAAPR
jgi:TonB family protein